MQLEAAVVDIPAVVVGIVENHLDLNVREDARHGILTWLMCCVRSCKVRVQVQTLQVQVAL